MRRPTLEDVYLELTGVRLFLHELQTEQVLFWRNREAAFFTFLLPMIFFLVFGSIYGNERDHEGAHQGRAVPPGGDDRLRRRFDGVRRARDHDGDPPRERRAEAHPRDASAALDLPDRRAHVDLPHLSHRGERPDRARAPAVLRRVPGQAVLAVPRARGRRRCFAAMGLGLTGFIRSPRDRPPS